MMKGYMSQLHWVKPTRAPQKPVAVTAFAAPARATQLNSTSLALEMFGIPQVPDEYAKTAAMKARYLLHAAAEIEHGLLAQYLYAHYSLNKALNQPSTWAGKIRGIAIQEMDHLINVQNMLLALRREDGEFRTYFDRQNFPVPLETLGRYPYAFRLEPLTGDSLAKYVGAESPLPDSISDPALRHELDAILKRAEHATGMAHFGHVGTLYAYLYWLFLPSSTTLGPWPDFPYEFFQDLPDEHVTPRDFADVAELDKRQADHGEFLANDGNNPPPPPNSGRFVFRIRNANDALAAIAQIAIQGEGTDADEDSHFWTFLSIYRELATFTPPPGQSIHLDVPTDPNLRHDPKTAEGRISNKATRLYARLCNTRYLMLLQKLPLALASVRDNGQQEQHRKLLICSAINVEMTVGIGYFAGRLTTLPLNQSPIEKAGVPFELPDQHLPLDPSEQWTKLVRLMGATKALLVELRSLQCPDKPTMMDETKFKQLETNDSQIWAIVPSEIKKTFPQDQPSQPETPPMAAAQLNSFADVQTFLNNFVSTNGTNIEGARHGAFWNTDYNSFVNGDVPNFPGVKILVSGNSGQSNLINILRGPITVNGRSFPRMPADGSPFMPDSSIALLADWIDRGCPNSPAGGGGAPPRAAAAAGEIPPGPSPMAVAQLNSFADVQAFLNAFVATNGTNIDGAPHGAFWNTDYNSFVNGDVPSFPGVKILVSGHSDQSNLISILRGPITVNGQSFPRMPADGSPFMPDSSIALLADWIDRSCPNPPAGGGGAPTNAAVAAAAVPPGGAAAPGAAAHAAKMLDQHNRVAQSLKIRVDVAVQEAHLPEPTQTPNSDEAKYADKCGTYTKCLQHDNYGRVVAASYQSLKKAFATGKFSDFENILIGGTRPLNGPQGALAYDLEGADSAQFVSPPAPPLASDAYGTELIELYWASLLRDVPFVRYSTSPVAQQAAQELSAQSTYQGPRVNGKVTTDQLFRGSFPEELAGPYLSQFFVQPTLFGQQPICQQRMTYQAGLDYMTGWQEWLDVQNGVATGRKLVFDPQNRFARDGRDLAAYTHEDVLYQAYFTALLLLLQYNAPLNPGIPYVGSKTEVGFGTLGGPDIAGTLAEVATRALKAVWYQKWVVHLRHRPESGGGIVQLIKSGNGGKCDGKLSNNILNSKALQASFDANLGSWLLAQAFPEGSPSHPAYPTGHGTVGGACITVLKFFFKGDTFFETLTPPRQPTDDGLHLVKYMGQDASKLTIDGELHKLASNVTFGHGIHAGIHWRSDSYWSVILGEEVALSVLRDRVQTYNEPISVTITRLNGAKALISNQ